MFVLLFLTILLAGLPSQAAESDILEGMESAFQNILKAAEKSGLSPKETVALLKKGRETLYRKLQAETRIELEILLSRDALYLGPLPVVEWGTSSERKSTYVILSPQQLRSRAQQIAQELETAFDQQRAYVLKLIRLVGGGNEYETCQAKDISTTEIPLVELTMWAAAYNFRVNKERGIRRFNEMYHRLKATVRQKHPITLFDCMIAGLIHRMTHTRDKIAQELSGRPTVIDADTLLVSDKRIRLYGIDAPEKEQRCSYANGVEYLCGVAATEELRAKIGTAFVRCVVTERGKYQRLIGRCHLGDTDLSDWLVEQGHALAYRPSSTQYTATEETAKAAKRGIWSGAFEKPWEWRQKH